MTEKNNGDNGESVDNVSEAGDNAKDDVNDVNSASGNDKGDGNDGNSSADSGVKTFTQAELSKIAAAEKKQGRNAGRNAAFAELGIDPGDEDAVNQVKQFMEFMKSKDDSSDGKLSAEAESRLAEAEERAAVAEMKAEAMQQGCRKEFVDDLVTLARSKSGEDTDIKTIIGEYRTKYPVWFEDDSSDDDSGGSGVGQKGTGSSVKGVHSKADEDGKDKGIGARLAASRKRGSSEKKSYWNN